MYTYRLNPYLYWCALAGKEKMSYPFKFVPIVEALFSYIFILPFYSTVLTRPTHFALKIHPKSQIWSKKLKHVTV